MDQVAAAVALESPIQPRLQLDVFEGPLELLLSLIEQHKLPITQVSLAQLADQYLAQVRALPNLNPDLLADFLAIGSKLLLLKSKALLLTEEPDPVVEETADELERRLAEYRVFRSAAEYLQALERGDQRTYPSTREPSLALVLAPLAPLGPQDLMAAWRRLQREPATIPEEALVVARVSVEERRALILDVLRIRPRVSFAEIAGRTVDEVIAAFLAILELFRRGQIDLDQSSPFGELTLKHTALL